MDFINKLKNKLRIEMKATLFFWLKNRELGADRNYRLDLVDQAFSERKSDSNIDIKSLNRIIDSYNKAKTVQKSVDSCYQVGNEWLPIYEKSLKEVMSVLHSRDVERLDAIYKNFFRDSCSTGLIGLALDMDKCFFHGNITHRNKKLFLYDALHRFKLWKSLLGNTHELADLTAPCVGNPYGYYIDGTFINSGSDYLHYYATAIGKLVRGDTHRIVVELGAGYGGMAYYLLRDNNNLSYIDFDLPENLALTSYYLLTAFPEKKILLFGESELTAESIANHDIVLMPNFEINKIPDGCADIVFNSYSLAEMSSAAIRTYIAEFTRILKGYFLHVNHNKVSEVVADDFGIDSDKFDLLYKIPALWNMGRNLEMDEYEYLYKKRTR
ncbi:MAG: putative sugar O-methyltransferase [Chlorobium sp.]|nr:putative sugar O-methyltransferase [Chlorobium sp.]